MRSRYLPPIISISFLLAWCSFPFFGLQSASSAQTSPQGTGRLAVYAQNPHYLQDANGKPMFLLGYNDSWLRQKPATLDQLNGKVNYLRTAYAGNNEEYHRVFPDPYLVGEPVVQRANGLWDFDTWDETFWANLHDYLRNTRDRGFIVGFVIWDGHWSLPGGAAGAASIWNSNRNVQGIQWAYDENALVNFPNPNPASNNPRERLVYYQRRWIDRLITEASLYPHVLIELNNEDSSASENWWLWWAQYFKERGGFVVAMNEESSGSIGAVSDTTFASTPWLDMKSYHSRSDAWITPTRLSFNKVIVADADNSDADLDATSARQIAWRSLLRGGHWNDYMESTSGGSFPNAQKIDYYGKLLNFLAMRNVPFWQMAPDGSLASSGFGLVRPGTNYLVYAESNVTVNLSGASGTLNYEWYDPRTGATAASGQVQGGAVRAFTLPGLGDFVLWVSSADRIPPAAPEVLRVQ